MNAIGDGQERQDCIALAAEEHAISEQILVGRACVQPRHSVTRTDRGNAGNDSGRLFISKEFAQYLQLHTADSFTFFTTSHSRCKVER
ncbi:hypothetical protein KIN20_022219 [Parelaphostrongylus tenuis]|uniref:Uncharacterized protein n=1 Tax=Parelaphostrongylus tenuis TaxID=148309 RepID=A0AAD5QWN0_PARTN|nr:hypothetical protein KIN20_022219 [Parelaphostrongylus tenuis]